MVKIILLLLSLSWINAFAAEGMVVVLEAPLFREPNKESPVIQYKRMGDKVYIHPTVVENRNRYDMSSVTKEVIERQPPVTDQMPIDEKVYNYHDGMDFVLTKDNQGRDAWMIREHVKIWYEDRREFSQKDPNPDPTDYRLLEPLPKNYPLIHKERLRGSFAFSMGTPQTNRYPYGEKIVAESYGYQAEFNAQLLTQLESDKAGRWFVGGIITVRTVDSTYTLETRKAIEQWTRLGGGAVVNFDAWRTEKNRLTLSWAALVYPFSQVNISQSSPDTGEEEIRNYWGWNLGSRAGAQWQRIGFLADLDFIAGLWGEIESPYNLQAKSGTNRPQWWRSGSSDSFNSKITFSLAGLVGIQSSY
ncbi:MAG: hypothetical protein K2P81_16630 [Bacteriovoracaceae bacterium]|nr:hypothetical protein [Bacteriovoracaceae bacterium]